MGVRSFRFSLPPPKQSTRVGIFLPFLPNFSTPSSRCSSFPHLGSELPAPRGHPSTLRATLIFLRAARIPPRSFVFIPGYSTTIFLQASPFLPARFRFISPAIFCSSLFSSRPPGPNASGTPRIFLPQCGSFINEPLLVPLTVVMPRLWTPSASLISSSPLVPSYTHFPPFFLVFLRHRLTPAGPVSP